MNNENNPSSIPNNQNGFGQNLNQPLNVIPSSMSVDNNQPVNDMPSAIPTNNNQGIEGHQFDNDFINRPVNNNGELNQTQNTFINSSPINNSIIPNQNPVNNSNEEINPMLNQQQNRFINNNIDTTSTSLNNLNIESSYSTKPKVDYSQDPKVQENLSKRNTITITSEGKVFIVIIIVLLLFIIVLPTVFDFFRNIKY